MYINSQLSTCVGTQSPKYIEMAQGHISLSDTKAPVIVYRTKWSTRWTNEWFYVKADEKKREN
jgi:hypothetical protein